MATFRSLSVLKQLSTTWCRRSHALLRSRCMHSATPVKSKDEPGKGMVTFHRRRPRKVLELHSIIKPSSVVSQYRECGETGGDELDNDAVKAVLVDFSHNPEIKKLCEENEISANLFRRTFEPFSKMCLEQKLRFDLHMVLNVLTIGKGDVSMLFPYYLGYSQELFPHLKSMRKLKDIADLTSPAQWYAEARERKRKVFMHVGPTNSGKTYHATKRFLQADSATYCCPLRLLAHEVCNNSNDQGVPCDMKTGELVTFAHENNEPGSHVACTVELANLVNDYEVAVIDEIQMIRDLDRGWAWTRAFLGLKADEIHLCGEESAIPLIQNLVELTGDTLEIKTYERLNELEYKRLAVGKYENVLPGDCIICFRKETIFKVSAELNRRGILTAIIYGSLPPATKIAQAKKFNDPMDPCKVMVATDAVGLGVNLNIKRIVFFSLFKNGITKSGLISSSLAQHIAGRAGRFGSLYQKGEVTTFHQADIKLLHFLKNEEVELIKSAGLQPTQEQMTLFSYYLPNASLKDLLVIFEVMAEHDKKNFFMCKLHKMKKLAELIDDVDLPMKEKFQYSLAPVDTDSEMQCNIFVELAKKHYNEEAVSVDCLASLVGWPLEKPNSLADLKDMENIFNCFDIFLWLGKHYPEIYLDEEGAREFQKNLVTWIEDGLNMYLLKSLTITQRMNLQRQAARRMESPDKMKMDKTEAATDTKKPTIIPKEMLGKGGDISELLTFLMKGGLSEKRLKTLHKKLRLDSDSYNSVVKIGKHPKKTNLNKKLALKNLGKMLKRKQ